MKRAHLIFACLILAPLAACKSVPPEVTVGQAGDGHGGILMPDPQAGGGAQGVADLEDDGDDTVADRDPTQAGPVQTSTAGVNGCKNDWYGNVPVVGRCRRIGSHRAVLASAKKDPKADGRHQAPRRHDDDAYEDDHPHTHTGEHKLTGWAAHTAPDTNGSTFDNVAGLFSDKQSFWMYHRSITPGSLVEVSANRRKVRVNVYRGDPPGGYHGRVAVLNYPAAARLDMLRRGRAWVQMRIVRDGPP
ncbi:MAG: hypothetical protein H6702_22830 [Myxococcales bacterium]|nr:hypothetical protein [Myxococcales bacterium]